MKILVALGVVAEKTEKVEIVVFLKRCEHLWFQYDYKIIFLFHDFKVTVVVKKVLVNLDSKKHSFLKSHLSIQEISSLLKRCTLIKCF